MELPKQSQRKSIHVYGSSYFPHVVCCLSSHSLATSHRPCYKTCLLLAHDPYWTSYVEGLMWALAYAVVLTIPH